MEPRHKEYFLKYKNEQNAFKNFLRTFSILLIFKGYSM